jgi:hypothetical protein
VFLYDIVARTTSQLAKMSTGRDLRNKIVSYNEEIFTIGGNKTCSSEKFNLGTKKWIGLKHYSSLVKDTLDSWYCALVVDSPMKNLASSAMFTVCDKLSAFDNRTNLASINYEENDTSYEGEDMQGGIYPDQLNYINNLRQFRLDNLEYDEEISFNSGEYSYQEEEDH